MVHKNWQLESKQHSKKLIDWAYQNHIDPFIAQLAAHRVGYNGQKIQQYLHPSLHQLRDPYLLHDMDKMVQRVKKAIAHHEKIMVYGDYDADGITSTTIMVSAIRELGGDVEAYVPNRFTDGYGPNAKSWQKVANRGTSLLITVDNGILADKASLQVVNDNNIDLIITDHHEFVEDYIPTAYAIVHAQYPGSEYPFDDFCGAGIAFKISCALLHRIDPNLMALAAIGTIADIVSVLDENRVIITYGLKYLQTSDWPGIKALVEASGLSNAPQINSGDIGFRLAPQLNALGRLGEAEYGFKMFMTKDENTAKQYAAKTKSENEKRKALGARMLNEAKKMAAQQKAAGHSTIVLAGSDWHQGIVGIVASNIMDKYNCPTLVLTHNQYHAETPDMYTGSGRSIEGFDIVGALDDYRDHLISMGGHPGACGLSIHQTEIEGMHTHFDQKFNTYKATHDTTPTIKMASSLNEAAITLPNIEELQQLAPFGHLNEEPIFKLSHYHILSISPLGKNKPFIQIRVANDNDEQRRLKIVGFGTFGNDISTMLDGIAHGKHLSLLGTIQENEYNGYTSPQMILQDWHLDENN